MGVIRCDQGEWKRIGMIESLEKVLIHSLGPIQSSHRIKRFGRDLFANYMEHVGMGWYGSNFCTPLGWSIWLMLKLAEHLWFPRSLTLAKKKCSEAAKMRNDVVDLWHRRTAEEAVYAILVLIDSAVLGRPWSMLDIRNMTR